MPKIDRRITFIFVGFLGAGSDFAIFWFLYTIILLNPIIANIISFHIAVMVGLILQARLTFALSLGIKQILMRYSFSYIILMYINLVASSLMLWAGISFSTILPLWIKLFSMVVIAIWSYFIQKNIIFKQDSLEV